MESRILLQIKRFVPELDRQRGVTTNSRLGRMEIICTADPKTREIKPICGKDVAVRGTYFIDFLVDPRNESVAAVIPGKETLVSSTKGESGTAREFESEALIRLAEPSREDPTKGFLRLARMGYVVHVTRLQDDSARVSIVTHMVEFLDGKPRLLTDKRYEGVVPMYRYSKLDPEAKIKAVEEKLCESELMVKRFAEDLAAGVVAAYEAVYENPSETLGKLEQLIPANILAKFGQKKGEEKAAS